MRATRLSSRVVAPVLLAALVVLGAVGLESADGGSRVAGEASDADRATARVPAPAGGGDGAGEPAEAAGPAGERIRDTDWWSVLELLDGRRARALQEVDPTALPSYAARGSPAWRADAALVADLERAGRRPVGLGSRLVAIESARPCPTEAAACLVMVDQRGAYTVVDGEGVVVEEVPQADPTRWQITLVPEEQPTSLDPGWRVSEVTGL